MTQEPSSHLFFVFPTLGVPSHQGEEQEVHLYYKMFSSTRHGFLGAGVVSQPLSHVWAAVSDPTLWPLYHKPIQTARLHQRVTNSINLGEPREGFPWVRARGQGQQGLEVVLSGGQVLTRPPLGGSGQVCLSGCRMTGY